MASRILNARRAALLSAGALALAAVAAPRQAQAACVPAAPVSNTSVSCTGATNDQNAPNGYGTGVENNLTITVAPAASVTGTNSGFLIDNGNSIANSGAITGTIFAGIQSMNSLTVVNAAAGTISSGRIGVLSNNGTLSVTNSGTISGGNSPGFGGVVSLGTLSMINSGTISGGDGIDAVGPFGTITNTGTISGNSVFGDGIFGVGTLSVINSGTISAGNSVGTFGVLSVGTLSMINSGTISGDTAVSFGAGGTITNTGTITGTGGTAIDASFSGFATTINQQAGTISGAIRLSTNADVVNVSGGTINGNIVGQGSSNTLNFALGGGTFTYAAPFGFSAINQVNVDSGTVVLNGANSATNVAINGGTLVVNGAIAGSAVTVNSGGTLAGIGTVGATTIMSGGTLAPGNSLGTITVAGSLAFQSGALYRVQVTPSTASSANVSGTATLTGASVNAQFAPGSYVTRQYTILHSGGLAGTFSGVTSSNPNFTVSLSYTAIDVILNLAGALGAGAGLSGNQQNVANAINSAFNSGGTLPPGFGNVFALTGANLGNALSQLSGEAATGAQQGAFQLMGQFLGVMLDPFVDGRSGFGTTGPALGFAAERGALPDDVALAYAKVMKAPQYNVQTVPTFEQRWTVWGSVYGGYNKTNGDSAVGSHDFNARAGGIAAGADYHFSRDTVAGFALAGGGTNWSLANGLGGGSSDVFQAGLYGATRWGPAYLAGSLAYAHHWMTTDRFAAFNDHLTAKFGAESFGGRVEGGYRFGMWHGGGVTPYAAVQAQGFRTPSYNETDLSGGGFGLNFASRTATDTRSELGARFDHVAATSATSILTLRGRLAWGHDWASDPALAAAFQALPGASFIVNGATPAKDSALVTAGAEWRLANGVALLAKFDGEFASGSQTYAGTGTVRYTW